MPIQHSWGDPAGQVSFRGMPRRKGPRVLRKHLSDHRTGHGPHIKVKSFYQKEFVWSDFVSGGYHEGGRTGNEAQPTGLTSGRCCPEEDHRGNKQNPMNKLHIEYFLARPRLSTGVRTGVLSNTFVLAGVRRLVLEFVLSPRWPPVWPPSYIRKTTNLLAHALTSWAGRPTPKRPRE